jgi:glycosyltransferase involved in cell wall biosynthesis
MAHVTKPAALREFVLIVEPNFTGHRWRYAQWAADAYTEAGHPCIIVTESSNADHHLARKIVAENRPDLEIAFVDPPNRDRSITLERISYVRHHRYFQHVYQRLSRTHPLALVVVPYVDDFFYALPFLGSPFRKTPWVGITMCATFHHRKVGVKAPDRPLINAFKARLFRHAVKSAGMRTLLSIDPTLLEWRRHTKRGHGAAIEYLADPFPDAIAEDPQVARARLGLPPGHYILVYGAINERKGIRELVEALMQMDDPPTLLVAGEQDPQTREFLQEHAPHMSPTPLMLDSFISNETEFDLFSACDAVWLGYKGHYGMSGVLVQAYRFGKPVIATADGLIGWFCQTGELGPVVQNLKPDTIAFAIEEVLFSRHHGRNPGHSEREHLLERNTLSQFKLTLQQAVGWAR